MRPRQSGSASGSARLFHDVGTLIAVACAVAGGGLLIVSLQSALSALFGILLLEQAFCIYFGYRRAIIQSRLGLPDFLSLYLTFVFFLNIFTFIDILFSDNTVGTFSRYYLNGYLIETQLIFFVGVVMFTVGWFLLGPSSAVTIPQSVMRSSVKIGVVLLGLWIGLSLIGGFAGRLGWLVLECYIALLFVQFLARGPLSFDGRRWWVTALMSLPPLLDALPSGSKERFIAAASPLWLGYLLRPTPRRVALLAAAGVAVVAIVEPLTQVIRGANWGDDPIATISTVEAASRVLDIYSGPDAADAASEHILHFVHRAAPISSGLIVYGATQQFGHTGFATVENLFATFIPRIFWPDKPLIAPGSWFTWYIGHANTPEEATTSTGTPLASEFYMMFGWPSVILGMLLLGFVYRVYFKIFCLFKSLNIIGAAAIGVFLMNAPKFHEMHVIYAITGPVVNLVYILILMLVVNLFQPEQDPRLSRPPSAVLRTAVFPARVGVPPLARPSRSRPVPQRDVQRKVVAS